MGETNLANMFADAIKQASGADLALINAGAIDGHFKPGGLNRRDLFTIVRNDTEIVLANLTGAQILAYLEATSEAFPAQSGAFAHLSGGAYAIDDNRTSDRVHSVQVNGSDIVGDQQYSVALPIGHLGRAKAKSSDVVKSIGQASAIVSEYLSQNSPVSPSIEGRIRILKR